MKHIIRAPLLIFAPLALVAVAAMAWAETAFAPSAGTTLAINNGPNIEFNWPEVQKCADRPLPYIDPVPLNDPSAPGDDNMLSEQYRSLQVERQLTIDCRWWLAARHAGYVAAGGENDPIPAVPIMRDRDKTPVVPE